MVWRFHMLCASMFVQRSRPQQHHCPRNPFPLPGHPSCIPSFRSQMYPFSCSGRALNISIRYEPNNTGCAIPFHSWRHNDIFPIAGLGTYISGVGIHLQLRGLIPFPSIGTHRRLVNHHTPGLFGLGSVAWQVTSFTSLIHFRCSAQTAFNTNRFRNLELISPGFTPRNLFGLNGTACGISYSLDGLALSPT